MIVSKAWLSNGALQHSSFRVFLNELVCFSSNKAPFWKGPILKSFSLVAPILTQFTSRRSFREDSNCEKLLKKKCNEEKSVIGLKQPSYILKGQSFYSNLLYNLFNHPFSAPEIDTRIMSTAEAMAQLESNAQTAEQLVQEIYSKLAILQNCNPLVGDEAQKLMRENEALKQEVQAWKEMLILQQIKNGGNPVVRDPRSIERSTVVEASGVKQEPQETKQEKAQPQKVEVKSAESNPPQQPGKKGKNKGGDAAAAAGGAGASKGGKQKGGGDQAATPDAQGSEEIDVGRLDLRIGLIKECTRHPDADSLYVEKIDVGEPNVRTVISGLVKHVPIDAMQNRMVVVLCNLKPSKMRGIMSEAMVMCASSPEKVEILTPPAGSAPGDVIEVDGYTRRPEAVMNPKKKIFETVAPDLKTNESKQATYKGVPWTVPGKGHVVAESLVNVNVK